MHQRGGKVGSTYGATTPSKSFTSEKPLLIEKPSFNFKDITFVKINTSFTRGISHHAFNGILEKIFFLKIQLTRCGKLFN